MFWFVKAGFGDFWRELIFSPPLSNMISSKIINVLELDMLSNLNTQDQEG